MLLFGWCQWLEHTPLALAISESTWLFPLIEGSHILALPLSVGMIVAEMTVNIWMRGLSQSWRTSTDTSMDLDCR
jgi:hypothetical protein